MQSLWFEQHLKDSTDEPRLHHQLAPNTLDYEDDIDAVGISSREENCAITHIQP